MLRVRYGSFDLKLQFEWNDELEASTFSARQLEASIRKVARNLKAKSEASSKHLMS